MAPVARVPLLVCGFAGLFVGVGAGLARFGYRVPELAVTAAALHGPLMVCAFFGVVIALERAVAIGRWWAYLGPAAAAAGSVSVIAGASAAAAWLFLAGSAVLVAASLDIVRRQPALFTFTLALGAMCWSVGTALWAMGSTVHDIVPWWLAFLILTIAGERLELSRFLMPSPIAKGAFAVIVAVLGAGLLGAGQPWGARTFATGLVALAVWLVRQDIARRTVRNRGLTRFIAVCLLSGYAWLAVGGGVLLAAGRWAPGASSYDAVLHALGLGFVFSMVFGHAPIILPAVLRVTMRYHWTFYLPLALLHASLALRLAGDALGDYALVGAGGLGNALALAAFIASTVGAVIRGRRRSAPV